MSPDRHGPGVDLSPESCKAMVYRHDEDKGSDVQSVDTQDAEEEGDTANEADASGPGIMHMDMNCC